MPKVVGKVSMHMGPQQTGAPDDLEAAIVKFIQGATKKLDIAVQELDNRNIAQAIIDAARRKVKVRLVLEADYLTVKKAVADPWVSGGENEANRVIQDAVLRSAIYVRSDFNEAIFHQKFIVRDGSALLMGSTNFTDTDTSANLNHVVVIDDKDVAKHYTDEFEEIRQGHFGKLNEGHDTKPPETEVSKVPVKVLFAPDHAPEMEIMKQMLKATKRVDFAIFTFAKSSGIDDTMIKLSQLGIPVRGALDRAQGNQTWAATRPVKNAGAELHLVGMKAPVRKLHHKLMVLDDQVVVVGSFNYTGPANALNDENIIILGDLESTNAASVAAQKSLASYARAEIDRIITAHGSKVV